MVVLAVVVVLTVVVLTFMHVIWLSLTVTGPLRFVEGTQAKKMSVGVLVCFCNGLCQRRAFARFRMACINTPIDPRCVFFAESNPIDMTCMTRLRTSEIVCFT